jgi:hypothetical protein
MIANEWPDESQELLFEQLLISDERVQDEFDQLNRVLAEINDYPVTESPEPSDPAWRIDDFEVSRWRIVVEGDTRLDRIAAFRRDLHARDDIVSARVERFDDGQICIRLVTTGGIPMGPLERAVATLTRGEARISQAS